MKIALIAHDKKKNEIIELAKKYKDVLQSMNSMRPARLVRLSWVKLRCLLNE